MPHRDDNPVESASLATLDHPSSQPGPQHEPKLSPTRLTKPPGATREVFWIYLGAFVVLHLLLPLAFIPWLFSWTGVALIFVGNYIFGSLGINLAYHRILTHQGLTVPKWLEHTFAVLGVCSLQDAPARWVAIHRMHHQYSDERRDPHTPLVDFFWGHIGWLIYQNKYFGTADFYDRYARDLLRDPFYYRLERKLLWFWIYVAHALLIFAGAFAIGWATSGELMGGLQFGLSIFVWGVIVRTVYVWHITWAVNSVTHTWGYRNYETDDESRNNWMVALCTNGEGWHNNHHAHPRCAAHGHRWWELDLTYWTILLLEKVGLAKNVVHPKMNPRQLGATE
jgi:stearoyl-CoA desaturase (delta-9 desaturase)